MEDKSLMWEKISYPKRNYRKKCFLWKFRVKLASFTSKFQQHIAASQSGKFGSDVWSEFGQKTILAASVIFVIEPDAPNQKLGTPRPHNAELMR